MQAFPPLRMLLVLTLMMASAAVVAVRASTAAMAQEVGKTVKTASGLQITDIKIGTGATPRPGQTCVMHYTGWLYQNGAKGQKFDSSVDRGRPFEFPLGQKRVIAGWDEGVASMKVGGKRTLVIPPEGSRSLSRRSTSSSSTSSPTRGIASAVSTRSASPTTHQIKGMGGGEFAIPISGFPAARRPLHFSEHKSKNPQEQFFRDPWKTGLPTPLNAVPSRVDSARAQRADALAGASEPDRGVDRRVGLDGAGAGRSRPGLSSLATGECWLRRNWASVRSRLWSLVGGPTSKSAAT